MITTTLDPARFDNPIHSGMHVLGKLREAGIPAIGVLYPVGVEWGALTLSAPDLADGSVTYSWAEEA